MRRLSLTEHPSSVGESYGEHFRVASSFGVSTLLAGLACLVDGVLPLLFTRTDSTAIMRLHDIVVTNRTRPPRRKAKR